MVVISTAIATESAEERAGDPGPGSGVWEGLRGLATQPAAI